MAGHVYECAPSGCRDDLASGGNRHRSPLWMLTNFQLCDLHSACDTRQFEPESAGMLGQCEKPIDHQAPRRLAQVEHGAALEQAERVGPQSQPARACGPQFAPDANRAGRKRHGDVPTGVVTFGRPDFSLRVDGRHSSQRHKSRTPDGRRDTLPEQTLRAAEQASLAAP